MAQSDTPGEVRSSDELGLVYREAASWQAKCRECGALVRSGLGGDVWHCADVRAGGRPVYAVTARGLSGRANHPTRGKCGPEAKLFRAAKA